MHTGVSADTDRLTGLFYEAAAAPALWSGALAAFADATGAVDAHIIAIDKEAVRPWRHTGVFVHRGPCFLFLSSLDLMS